MMINKKLSKQLLLITVIFLINLLPAKMNGQGLFKKIQDAVTKEIEKNTRKASHKSNNN
ncbi:MAG: hypothetical protein QM763_12605 [Agriterribacter sp.]